MPKKTNESPRPQNALNKFMCRILFERDELNRAYASDGSTLSIFNVKPPIGAREESDDIGGLVDSHLEDMYHSLYGEPLELRKLLIEAKAESVKAGVEFKLILNPLLDAMFEVQESCIEDLRNGKGWNWVAHGKAFDRLKHELEVYSDRINQITANTVDRAAKPKLITKKLKPLSKVEIKRAKWILKMKKGRYLGSPITDGTIAQFFNAPESFPIEFRPDPAFDLLTTKQGVSKALKKYLDSLNLKTTDN